MREVDPPWLADQQPLAYTAGHWTATGGAPSVWEMAAVYPADYDAAAVLAGVRRTLDGCLGVELTVTTVRADTVRLTVEAGPAGPAGSVLWSLRSPDWNCDNLLVAAANAAIEMTACSTRGGFDTASAATAALQRIDRLVNTRA